MESKFITCGQGSAERGEKGGGGLREAWRYAMGTKETWVRG